MIERLTQGLTELRGGSAVGKPITVQVSQPLSIRRRGTRNKELKRV